MKDYKRETRMGRWLAVALCNCDPSGLNEDDYKLYKSIDFDFDVTDWAEESTGINDICDYSGLWDHCVTIEHD